MAFTCIHKSTADGKSSTDLIQRCHPNSVPPFSVNIAWESQRIVLQREDNLMKKSLAVNKNHIFTTAEMFVMKKLYDNHYPIFAKLIWGILILLCSFLTLLQITDRIQYYLSQPVTMNIQVQRNDSMMFPSITICNKSQYRKSSLHTLKLQMAQKNKIAYENITTDDLIDYFGWQHLLKNAGYHIPDMLQECFIYRGQTCHKPSYWNSVFTVMGLCYTYSIMSSISTSGPYNSFYIVLKNDEQELEEYERGWKVLIHQATETPALLVLTNGLTMYPDARADIVISLHQFRTLNRKLNPCNPDPEYLISTCEAKCQYHIIARTFHCRLPYMDLPDYPFCNSSVSNAISEFQEDLLENNTFLNKSSCGCQRQCNENMFSAKFDIRRLLGTDKSVVKVYYESLTYEKTEETFSYGLVSLLSDIGGILGLFLGACVISIFEVVEVLMRCLIEKLKAYCKLRAP